MMKIVERFNTELGEREGNKVVNTLRPEIDLIYYHVIALAIERLGLIKYRVGAVGEHKRLFEKHADLIEKWAKELVPNDKSNN